MRLRNRWIPLPAPRWIIASIVALFLALALVVFFVLPGLMVAGKDLTIAAERIKAENDIRTTGLQFLGGAVLALGALFTGVALIYNRESQITDRFTRAIDHLGHAEQSIRVGGIYALERIARDSHRDREPVMELLITHVKENAPLTGPGMPVSQKVAPDIQAALTAIGRRKTNRERKPLFIDLSDTNLVGADLSRGAFVRADFTRANLRSAELTRTDLRKSTLVDAHLEEAKLVRTKLSEAVLDDADCRGAEFERAELDWVSLKGTDLRQAKFWAIDLREVRILIQTKLEESVYDFLTLWPLGFDPTAAGATRVERPPD
jgi:hypothetical protein